ncbi:MAG: ribosomal protein S18-alanine N-acetyltransferase [Lachnospiraceae bacterium]|nr:ribosomal protein S18-alanine N-acetyltransferase [Lachnospiraceae bacterium]
MSALIRYINEEDVLQVSELEKKYFALPWSYDSIKKEVTNDNSIFCVAAIDSKVVGYGGMLIVMDEGDITNIVVDEAYRNLGIGKKIVEFLIEEGDKKGCNSYTLEVRVSNEPAIRLYNKLGFENAGVRPEFYEKPVEDAYIMWKYKKC